MAPQHGVVAMGTAADMESWPTSSMTVSKHLPLAQRRHERVAVLNMPGMYQGTALSNGTGWHAAAAGATARAQSEALIDLLG
jgi:hypothetical protein